MARRCQFKVTNVPEHSLSAVQCEDIEPTVHTLAAFEFLGSRRLASWQGITAHSCLFTNNKGRPEAAPWMSDGSFAPPRASVFGRLGRNDHSSRYGIR